MPKSQLYGMKPEIVEIIKTIEQDKDLKNNPKIETVLYHFKRILDQKPAKQLKKQKKEIKECIIEIKTLNKGNKEFCKYLKDFTTPANYE